MNDHWADNAPDDLSNPVRNIIWACDQILERLDAGTYRHDDVHVRADLSYIRAEARRAHRNAALRALGGVQGAADTPDGHGHA